MKICVKKQFAKFGMLQIEEDNNVDVIYIFVTPPFRTEVIQASRVSISFVV